jgi:23S rRNA (cytosine1962-C5)-methyltransferase
LDRSRASAVGAQAVAGAGRRRVSADTLAGLSLPKAKLRKDLRRALHAGQPWIYRDALAAMPGAREGEVVLVLGKDGRPLGRGFFDAHGAIAIRMLTTERGDEIPELVRARLEGALAARRELFESGKTTAFRWVHGEGDRLPGLHVDVYGAHASVFFDGSGPRAFYVGFDLPALLVEVGSGLGLSTVLERARRDGAERSEARVLLGPAPAGELEVLENGLTFGVDLLHGQKGGLFLDQRENRARVRALAKGRRVLNLFGYTGGFSLYAALGGATRTTTVDVSRAAIDAARENFARNAGLLGEAAGAADFVAMDAFAFLEAARARGDRYELVISDPPSFAPNERVKSAALASYRRLHALAAGVVAPGGTLCAASCSSHVAEAEFLDSVRGGAGDAGRRFELRELHGAASDHPVLPEFAEGHYLKFAIGAVR